MFLFKKIIALLFFPLSICFEVLFIGIFLLWFSHKQKAGKIVVCLGVILLMLFSCSSFSDILLKSLEDRYILFVETYQFSDIKWVVVLGGGSNSNSKFPVTSQLCASSLSRLIEGIRIHKLLPKSKLVLSGGVVFDPVPISKTMASVAEIMGIEGNKLILEEISKDTKDQARLIYKIVEDERFILVTSASHMPRSMALFQKLGMKPIPAPTDYQAKKRHGISPSVFFPNADSLRNMERVLHEYLGLVWARFLGQI